jgi:hypothetical protein
MSEWRVSSMWLNGKKYYQVYRIKDMKKVDHSGNREYKGGLMEDEFKAISLAKRLNARLEEVMS